MEYKGFKFSADETFSSIHKRLLKFFDITDYNVNEKTSFQLDSFREFENEVKKMWLFNF